MYRYTFDFINKKSMIGDDSLSDLRKAKLLFFSYGGSHHMMANDGRYEEYKKCNVPKKMEKEWGYQLLEDYYKQLSVDPDEYHILSNICFICGQLKDELQLNKLIDFMKQAYREEKYFKCKFISKQLLYLFEILIINDAIELAIVEEFCQQNIKMLQDMLLQQKKIKAEFIAGIRNWEMPFNELENISDLENDLKNWKEFKATII